VDLAIGADQRGSGRIPAAWCGVVAIKATHGLVPSFGVIGMDHTLDHVCPMARTVAETALGLEVIAGDDLKDPQWVRGQIKTDRYTQALGRGVKGVRVGLLREAFEWSVSDPEVNEAVREAVQGLARKGAVVKEVSLPLLKDAEAIWNGIVTHSMSALVESDGEGYWRGGYCNVGLQAAFGAARRTRADDFAPFTKVRIILGKYLRRRYMSTYFSKAQNLRMVLREETDRLLQDVDVLATPTTPQKPFKLLEKIDPLTLVTRAPSMTLNTSFTDITGHPSLSVPCGQAGGLPVGLQLVGRHWEESLLFAVGATVEACS
jgi:amidase